MARPGGMRHPQWRRRWGIAAVQTFDVQVEADADDGYCNNPGNGFNNNGTRAFIGENGGFQFFGWALFDPVDIPAGATVTAASLRVVADGSGADGSGVKTNIFFEAIDDSDVMSDWAEWDAATRTGAGVAWDDEDFTIDVETESPDISAVVQEILDRGGWNSGQAMSLLWDDDTSSAGKFYDIKTHDGSATEAIKLHVEYTT